MYFLPDFVEPSVSAQFHGFTRPLLQSTSSRGVGLCLLQVKWVQLSDPPCAASPSTIWIVLAWATLAWQCSCPWWFGGAGEPRIHRELLWCPSPHIGLTARISSNQTESHGRCWCDGCFLKNVLVTARSCVSMQKRIRCLSSSTCPHGIAGSRPCLIPCGLSD